MGDGLYLNAAGDRMPWEALDEAEQGYYVAPLAEGIVEHVCRYWRQTADHETFFGDASLPAAPDRR